MQYVRSIPFGLEIGFTQALGENQGKSPKDYHIQQWRYEATARYGGLKLNLENLSVKKITISSDRKTVQLQLPHIKPKHVIYIRLSDKLLSKDGENLWAGEAWYTLNSKGWDGFYGRSRVAGVDGISQFTH